ncbi:MAG: cysteine desulfurase family protein [Erysipelotrichaceae bacterium]
MIYLDNAATTKLDPQVQATYVQLLEQYYANPSSIHALGVKTNSLMQQSRQQLAKNLKVNSDELTFTASASEANNMAIKGYVFAHQHHGKHLICSRVEHSSVKAVFEQLETYFGFEVTYVDLDESGIVSTESLKRAMRKDTIFVACMMVNNEVGSINDTTGLARIAHQNLHCAFLADGVQALGKIPIDLTEVDFATFSAHKIHGLKGSAILYHKRNKTLLPLIVGGEQEAGLRAGTSNVVTNIVLAKTVRLALESQKASYEQARHYNHMVRDAFRDWEDVVFHSPKTGSPFILSMSVLVLGSEIMMNALEVREIFVSAKSTCSSKSKAHSSVLAAMKKSEAEMNGVLRISFSKMTTEKEVMMFIQNLKEIINEYRTK